MPVIKQKRAEIPYSSNTEQTGREGASKSFSSNELTSPGENVLSITREMFFVIHNIIHSVRISIHSLVKMKELNEAFGPNLLLSFPSIKSQLRIFLVNSELVDTAMTSHITVINKALQNLCLLSEYYRIVYSNTEPEGEEKEIIEAMSLSIVSVKTFLEIELPFIKDMLKQIIEFCFHTGSEFGEIKMLTNRFKLYEEVKDKFPLTPVYCDFNQMVDFLHQLRPGGTWSTKHNYGKST